MKKNAREPPNGEKNPNDISGRSFSSSIDFHALSGTRYLRSLFRNGLRAGLAARWQMAFSETPPLSTDLAADTVQRQLHRF